MMTYQQFYGLTNKQYARKKERPEKRRMVKSYMEPVGKKNWPEGRWRCGAYLNPIERPAWEAEYAMVEEDGCGEDGIL
jgi:hypothetical protein